MATKIKQQDQEEIRLIKLAQKEDLCALDILFKRNISKLDNSIKSFGVDDDLRKEILQKTLIKIWKNIKGFRFQSSFYTWCYRISFNLFIDEKRKKSRKITISFDDLVGSLGEKKVNPYFLDIANIVNSSIESHFVIPSPRDIFQKKENEEQQKIFIDKILSSLTSKHKEVLLMYEYEGKSYEEIAKKLNCSVGTIMSRLFYARINAKRATQRYPLYNK